MITYSVKKVSPSVPASTETLASKAEDERFEARLSIPHAPVLAMTAASGALAGAVAGTIAGPVGAAIGGLLGAAIGAAAGEVLEEGTEEHDAHDAELDAIIGVTRGDIGVRKPSGARTSRRRPSSQSR